MISFFINLYRFVNIIFTGIKKDSEFRFLLIFLVLLLVSSTLFYHNQEGWSVIDSLFFSVVTMSTVGYGDLYPVTDMGKIFTVVYIFLSIGTFVAFTAKMIALSLEKDKIKREKRKKKYETI